MFHTRFQNRRLPKALQRRRSGASHDPRILESAKFGNCTRCDKDLRGARAVFYPGEHKAYCWQCGETEYLYFLSAAADEAVYNGTGSAFAR